MIENILYHVKISTVETFGYLIIFLATLLEASPGIGIFIPGSIIIFFAGFVSKMHMLNFFAVLIFAILGAILGDLFGYLFGRYCGKGFLHRFGKYFLIRREYIERSGDIAHEHTGKSLVIGRLNPITRSAAPFIVGAHRVKFWKFMFFNILGGVLWGFLFVSLGFIFGKSLKFALSFEKWIIFTTFALIISYYSYYFMKKLFGNNGKCEN